MGSLGGGSSQPSGTVVQKTDTSPWAPQQDYLKTGFSEAQKLYDSQTPEYYAGNTVNPLADQTQTALDLQQARAEAGSPLTTAAQDQALNILRGDFMGSNPYLQNAIDAASAGTVRNYQNAIAPGIDSNFEKAGRYGSGAYQDLHGQAQQNLGDTLGNMASGMSYQNYNQGMQNMQSMIGQADALSQADYNDIAQLARVGSVYEGQSDAELQADIARHNFEQQKPYEKLGNFMGMVGGGYGTQGSTSTPYFNNRGANVLSGALGGLGAAAKLGGSMSNPWTWGMGALGGLGGLL